MASGDEAPVIIKKVVKGGGDGHHGGAWKVAYADFVTAMMAFFLLMWLLNATTEQQRAGIADFFTPTVPISPTSGGGSGAFGGDSVFSEETLAQNGSGATSEYPTSNDEARGETGFEKDGEAADTMQEVLESVNEELRGHGGESAVLDNALEHIITRVTDEGMVIEVFSTEGNLIFEEGTDRPTPMLRAAVAIIKETTKIVSNPISVGGHVPSKPVVVSEKRPWELSAEQATTVRKLFESIGFPTERFVRVSGHADRELVEDDPLSIRNNRVEIILMRE